jgi:hypothetical protein
MRPARLVYCLAAFLLSSFAHAAVRGRIHTTRPNVTLLSPLQGVRVAVERDVAKPEATQLQRLKKQVIQWGRLKEVIGDEVLENLVQLKPNGSLTYSFLVVADKS